MARRILLISKAVHIDTPHICLRVLGYDEATGVLRVIGSQGHIFEMTMAHAKAGYERYVQEVGDAQQSKLQT